MVDTNKTYVGIVEDNQDPKKIGRVKVRVMDVFDDIPLEDIPWAMPWKDLNGNQFNTPERGKVVMVVFDQGNQDNPEFIYSDHYNINLENKLSKLSDSDYLSMKSLIFDHKTQLYVNDSEGLKIDHKYNNINLIEDGINLNLKDNNASINIGDASADQQAILGNHFMDWLDEFLEILLKGGLFNIGGPALSSPALLKSIIEFKALKDIKFLSHHVNIVDNNKIKTVNSESREDDPQYGDKWTSTKDENNLTEKKQESFQPREGPKEEFNQPVEEEKTQSQSVVGEQGSSVNSDLNSSSIGVNQNTYIEEPPKQESPLVERLIKFLESKNYKVFGEKGILNMVAFRNKDNGVPTNKFDESLFVFYRDNNSEWELKEYKITTVPGEEIGLKDTKILAFGQYVDQCIFNQSGGVGGDSYREYGSGLIFNQCAVYINNRDDFYSYSDKVSIINRNDERFGSSEFPIGIFGGKKSGSKQEVSDWS
jgi:hypothetical protein